MGISADEEDEERMTTCAIGGKDCGDVANAVEKTICEKTAAMGGMGS